MLLCRAEASVAQLRLLSRLVRSLGVDTWCKRGRCGWHRACRVSLTDAFWVKRHVRGCREWLRRWPTTPQPCAHLSSPATGSAAAMQRRMQMRRPARTVLPKRRQNQAVSLRGPAAGCCNLLGAWTEAGW